MRALALPLTLLTLVAIAAPAAAAPTPKPAAKSSSKPIRINLPTVPLHAWFVVEVNAKGQVVRVKAMKGTGSKYPFFNAQTYGNVLQMWIRHPDGSAEVGLYRVTYDYDPKTRKIARRVSIVQRGGDWGNDKGAATVMIDTANREARANAQKQQQAESKSLPPLNAIVGSPSSSPSPHP